MNETEPSRSSSPASRGPGGRTYPAALGGILFLLALGLILVGVFKRYPVGDNGRMSETELVQAITVGGVAPSSSETQAATQPGASSKIKETKGQDYCPT